MFKATVSISSSSVCDIVVCVVCLADIIVVDSVSIRPLI